MKIKSLFFALLVAGPLLFVGCANSKSADVESSVGIEAPGLNPEYSQYSALIWEKEQPEGKNWSNYLFGLLDKEAPDLINGAQDMDSFCPHYNRLLRSEKILFWAHLITQMTKFESGFDPKSRMRESGTDAITGQPLYSEGLLQLSYQDLQMVPSCEFSWSQDKQFSATDARRTILNPYRNLRCGVKILNRQLNRNDRIVMNSGAYWAVIKGDSAYSMVSSIQKFTKALAICQRQ